MRTPVLFLIPGVLAIASAQTTPPEEADRIAAVPPPQATVIPKQQEDKRILGILPNYRTLPAFDEAVPPLTPREKFVLAAKDSFDYSAVLVAGFYAGLGQLQDQYPAYGQGGAGYGKRFAGAFADQVIGNFMSEAIFPTVFHQDPRYYRMGRGGFRKRCAYAVSRIWLIRGDNGKTQFNWGEIAGNAAAAGISTAYYPADNRTFSDTASKWGTQIATDAGFNIIKEFWPEIKRVVFRSK